MRSEKSPNVAQQPLASPSGISTPTSPMSDDTMDEADKTLEAMGYTPVRLSSF